MNEFDVLVKAHVGTKASFASSFTGLSFLRGVGLSVLQPLRCQVAKGKPGSSENTVVELCLVPCKSLFLHNSDHCPVSDPPLLNLS